jgi:cell division protein FtsB
MSQVNLGIWSTLIKLVSALLGLALLAGVCIWYLPLIQQNQRIRQQILYLNEEIQQESAISRHLQISINALQKDPKTVERLARQNLGYCKPGETVIRFDAPPATNVAPAKP